MTSLSSDRPQDFLLEVEAADLLRLSERTLQRRRQTGAGPEFRRLGRRVVYARCDLLAWADSCRHLSTAAAGLAQPQEPRPPR